MKTCRTPVLDARYWVAILLASIFGANMGDLFAHGLGLGHVEGLFPLALLFAATLLLERRATFSTEAFYWLAIVTLRTAATNLGDLLTEDLRLSYPMVSAALAVLLAVFWLADRSRRSAAEDRRLPGIDGLYWAAMLTAGTLGTVGGDFLAHTVGLGTACVASLATLIAILAVRIGAGLTDRGSYWIAIVAVRTAGTNVGDFFAGRRGFNIGLPMDTALFAALLVACLVLWRRQPALVAQDT